MEMMMGNIDYATDLNRAAQRTAAQEQKERNDAAWSEILDAYPISSCIANRVIVESYCNGDITVGKFEFLAQNPPPGLTLVWADEHGPLLDAICQRLYDPYGRRMNEHSLRVERVRMSYWSRAKLRAKLRELIARQDAAKRPVEELKSELKEYRRQEAEATSFNGYPKLLDQIVPPGEVTAVPTGEFLRKISSTDLWLFKRYVRMYGAEQCNKFLGK